MGVVIIPVAALAACSGQPPAAHTGASPSALLTSSQTPASLPTKGPLARFGGAMAYDEATHTVVLFGGQGATGYLSDTWTWNGTTWTEQHPPHSPTVRYGARMAYDAANKGVVLVGGIGNLSSSQIGDLADTWIWNGTTWTERYPTVSPPARHGSSLAYDRSSGQVVLFGGDSGVRAPLFLNDTWTWSGAAWAKQTSATSPPGRADAIMSYDDAANQLVLFGGASGRALDDTWVWAGQNWTQKAPSLSPGPRYAAAASYSAGEGQLVLFGGYGSFGTRLGDTWAWRGETWHHLYPSNQPPARVYASMSPDAAGHVLLFGGSGDAQKAIRGELSDTWSWDAATWNPAAG